jgi:hypothetical protein
MKGIGLEIKPMGLAYNFILMEANLKEIGSMINNMALVQKYGRMEQNT